MPRTIVAVTAGLSQPSSTRLLTDRIADAVTAAVTARGEAVDVEVIELRELAVDLAQSMITGGMPTGRVAEARDRVSAADGLIVVTPVFTASYNGLLKMFFDLLDVDSINGMPTIIAATAGTPRHSLVLDHALRPLLSYLRAVVVPTGVFAATDDFGADGGSDLSARIVRAAGELAALVVAETGAVEGFAPTAARPRQSGNTLGEVTDFAELLRGHAG
ncbi:FMN reductase [Cumulibacter manganitolerans]|uniref:FMN reductase n=1 Tax=Cumulibacter manganitolerans TaxID=1884992 RepID=UPI00129647EF|nr:FMN reductase [Cumulibacter manganitolerans]